MAPLRRILVAAVATVSLAGAALGDLKQPEVPFENQPFGPDFTFVRLRFQPTEWYPGPYYWGLDLKWNHDYPFAETNFMRILQELTLVEPNLEGSNILDADDPELFKYPIAYLCEPYYWKPSDGEVRSLRSYLLKGGMLIVDDFWDPYPGGPQLANLEMQMRRILPEARLLPLDASHPIFQSFFKVDDLDFTHPQLPYVDTRFYGYFEDNDPDGRLLAIINYNNDIGDYWEWSDVENSWYPIDLTKRGFQLGVNYVIFGLSQ